MRVLAAIVVPPHLTASGGASAGEQLSDALCDHCDVTVASMMPAARDRPGRTCREPVRTSLPPGLASSRLPNKARTLFYRSDLPRIVADGKFDLVHLHNPMPGLEMSRVANACLRARVPYVVTTHGFNEVMAGETVYGFGPLRRLVWRNLVRNPVARAVHRADAILALSPADVPLVRRMGFDGDVPVVPNGVALPRPADPGHDAEVLAHFGIPGARDPWTLTCMFLANHTPNKGLPVLLEAFRSLDRPFRLIVGGERRAGIDYDGVAGSLRPGQRIVVTGRLRDDEIPALMRRSDLFVFPTLADTFPLVVLESMAQGLPVVASDVGGIPYEIAGGCGRLVPAGDAAALALAISQLADDPDELAAMGARARRRVSDYFTWPEVAKLAADVYRAVLDRRAAADRRPSAGLTPAPVRPGSRGATRPAEPA